jgi:CRISPR/Cas system-associated endonuclease Cas1
MTYTGAGEFYFEEEGRAELDADKAELKKSLEEWTEASSKNENMNAVDNAAKAYFQAIYNETKDL